MRYIQPQITNTSDATLAIQSVGSNDTSKPDGMYLDSAVYPPQYTTIMAYESDE